MSLVSGANTTAFRKWNSREEDAQYCQPCVQMQRLMFVWFPHATLTTLVWSRNHLCPEQQSLCGVPPSNLVPVRCRAALSRSEQPGAIWFQAWAMRRPMTPNRPLAPYVSPIGCPRPTSSSANLRSSVPLLAVAGPPAAPPARRKW